MNPLQSLKNLLEGIADVINFIDGGFRRMSDTFSGAFTSLSPTSILKGGA